MDAAGFAESVRRDAPGWDERGEVPAEVRQTMADMGLLEAAVTAAPAGLGELAEHIGGV
jgi:methoxymalonate biosynthesis protein